MISENVSHYRVLRKIGSGRLGEVYLAQDTTLGRTVALKILHPKVAQDPDFIGRFLLEAKTVSALDHPNVAHIYEVGEADGTRFIAMQFVEGETLQSRLPKGSMAISEILEIGIQVTDALEEAHSKGISHGELNSSNIMVTSRGPVKVLDFGLARIWNQSHPESTQDLAQGFSGAMKMNSGAFQYLSPEQSQGRRIDRRSDIYSIGVILYELTTGRLPFSVVGKSESIQGIFSKPAESVTRYNHQAPAELDRIIHKCMEKDPEYRYQSARDLLVDLRNLQRDYESGTALMSGDHQKASFFSKRQILLTAGILLLAVAFGMYRIYSRKQTIHSLAVLPFVNATEDPEMEYLSDGITETAINSLSQLPNMKVLARGTVFTYKGKDDDPRKVGQDLNVDAVVTGNIQQQGKTLVIQANLVDTKDGVQIWGERYSRGFEDLLTVQAEISNEISRNLRLTLTGKQQEQLKKVYTHNTEAYQLYLKGRYYWNMRTREGMNRAIESFQKAIEKDPEYALAYSGLSDSYAILSNWGFLPPGEGYSKAKTAVLEALKLDDSLAEAYASLGSIQSSYDWNWQEAEKSFRQAISLNPNYATAHHWYSFYLSMTSRHEEAMLEMQQALQLDPLSMIINANLGYTLYIGKKYDQSLKQLKKTEELDPSFALTYQYMGYVYQQKGMNDLSIEVAQKAVQLSPDNLTFRCELARAYAIAGRRAEAEKILHELQELSLVQYVPSFDMASAYAGLGDKEKTFQWLQRAYEEHSDNITYIKMEPRFDALRSDPRFVELLRRIRLS